MVTAALAPAPAFRAAKAASMALLLLLLVVTGCSPAHAQMSTGLGEAAVAAPLAGASASEPGGVLRIPLERVLMTAGAGRGRRRRRLRNLREP